MKKLSLLSCLLFAAPAAAQVPADTRAIEQYLASVGAAGHLSGTVLVARGNDILIETSYGSANGKDANTPATLFAIASITKPLTGIATRLLAERAVLNMDAPIAQWLPDFPNGSAITVGHLVTHRSGLPHRVTTFADEQAPQTPESMAKLIARAPLAFEPGARRSYSSAGFTLLAYVLERASGKPYAQLMHELILDPAKAANAIDATESAPGPRARATGNFWTPAGKVAAPTKQLSFLAGAGSLWATPRDLFNVVRHAVAGGYGTTATSGARDANGAMQWAGWSNGFQAAVDYDAATDVTIIYTSNLLTGANDWLVRDLKRLLNRETLERPLAPQPRVVALTEVRRKQIEGVYNFFGNVQRLEFISPTTALLGGEYMLLATGDSSFFAPQNFADWTVEADATGRITAIQAAGPPAMSMQRQ